MAHWIHTLLLARACADAIRFIDVAARDDPIEMQTWQHAAFEGRRFACAGSGRAKYGIFDRWSEPVDVAGEVVCAAERFGGPLRGRLEGSVKECRCLAGLDHGRPLAPTCPRLGRRVAVFGFGKDEVDVVAAWVHHHASLFGYENLHVVDNHSTDGTWEARIGESASDTSPTGVERRPTPDPRASPRRADTRQHHHTARRSSWRSRKNTASA